MAKGQDLKGEIFTNKWICSLLPGYINVPSCYYCYFFKALTDTSFLNTCIYKHVYRSILFINPFFSLSWNTIKKKTFFMSKGILQCLNSLNCSSLAVLNLNKLHLRIYIDTWTPRKCQDRKGDGGGRFPSIMDRSPLSTDRSACTRAVASPV